MKLNTKMLVFFSVLMIGLLIVLSGISLYSFREFSLYTAERHAQSVAETIKVGLTESMVNGTISKRQEFIDRLSHVPGVDEIHVLRGPAVVKQFGYGTRREHSRDLVENGVLSSGKPSFDIVTIDDKQSLRAVIPYSASDKNTPNCMGCHEVERGTVLGAVAIHVPLYDIKKQAIFATLLISMSVFLTALIAFFLLRKFMNPLVLTTGQVKEVVTKAVSGSFEGRVLQHSNDEVGEIADSVNKLMKFMDENITSIVDLVGNLMNYHPKNIGNQLVTTTEMVEALVDAAKFKQAIEEDECKIDVYHRLADVLIKKYDVSSFSIYEVSSSNNKMVPVIVNGEDGGACTWCDQQSMLNSGSCRVKRTGHAVNSIDTPNICTMFKPDGEKNQHICLPINQSGAVGCVVQLIITEGTEDLFRFLIPFIQVYLREAAPVLEAKRLMEHLRESSLRDAMTGLYNRRFLEEYVTTLMASSQRRSSPFSILMLDLDYFKQVNDTFGHEAGDKVLKVLAEILQKSVRSSDLLIRYGGEEFLIVLMDTDGEGAVKAAEKIRKSVEETRISLPGTSLQKTISIGVSELPKDADTFWQAVKYADVALYYAKEHGRNQVVRFSTEMWTEKADY